MEVTAMELVGGAASDQFVRLAGWQLGRLSPMPSRLPGGWELVRLTSVARLESGHTPSRRHPEYWDGGIPWVSLHDSAGLDVPEIQSTAQTISTLGLEHSSARLLPKGTVVFSRTATVGKSTVIGREMATSQDFANYVCGSRLHNHYLVHLFRFMGPEWKRLMAGSTHNSIYMPVFQDLQIMLPPIGEQEAIAEALGDADALIESLEGLVAKKRQIKQGAMQELLAGKKRLPGFSGEWGVVNAGDIGRFRGGGGFPTKFQGATSGEYPFFKVSDMNNEGNETFMETANNYISEALRKQLGAIAFPANSIVFAKVGAAVFLERKKLLARTSCLDNNMAAFILDTGRADRRFIHYLLLNTKLSSLVSTTALPSLSGSVLAAIEFVLPPPTEQTAIAVILSEMDAELAALEARLAKACQIKQGMMQALLTGGIRLA